MVLYEVKHIPGAVKIDWVSDLNDPVLKVNGDDTIQQVNFEGEGCTISQAAASILTEMVEGGCVRF